MRNKLLRRAATPDTGDTIRSRWRFLPRLLVLIWRLDRRDVLMMAGFTLIGGLAPIITLVITQRLIDQAIAAATGAAVFSAVGWWLLAFFLMSFLESSFTLAHDQFKDTMLERVRMKAHELLIAKVSRLSMESFESAEHYDLLTRAQQGLDNRFWMTMTHLVPLPLHLITFLTLLFYVGAAHGIFPVMLLVGLLPLVVARWRQDHAQYLLNRAHTSDERRLEYFGTLMLERAAAAEVRLFGLQSYLLDQWHQLYRRLRNDRLELARREMGMLVLPVLCEQLIYGLVITGVIALVAVGRISIGYLVSYLGAVERFLAASAALLSGVATIDTHLRYLRDVLNYLDLSEEEGVAAPARTPERAANGTAHMASEQRDVPAIAFEQVSFTYPTMNRPVLENVSFVLQPGERLALVGVNGAGKTTLVKLLLGLYRPTSGRITVNGIDLKQLDIREWRRRIGVVFQDYVKYELTARENIGFGDLSRMDDLVAIQAAAAKSGADAVVNALPAVYDTQLGKTYYNDGCDLSIGQWQKLAIARAYLRDADVLVLDEPTAALDAKAEAAVYEQFRTISQGRSALLISHRLGSARRADRIIVLEQGQIIEQGGHISLISKQGRYAELFSIQSEWYR